MLAFEHAVALGVDALECDVHLSRDGELVVIHDATLDRTTDAAGAVAALTAAELARVDAGWQFAAAGRFPYRGRAGGVPRLVDLLERFPALPIVIELKGERPEIAGALIDVIDRLDRRGTVIVGGFSQVVLTAVRQRAPDLVTSASSAEVQAALRRSVFRWPPRRTGFRLFQVPIRLRGRPVLNRTFVRVARRAGIPVQAWIVDEADDMRRLIDWGVTGLISDRPDVALSVARERRELWPAGQV